MGKIKKDIQNRGSHITHLNENETITFLKKYKKIIYFECKKLSFIPGFSIEDLMQECEIKLIAGYHTFRKKKASEKTWVINVIRKTLYGIWNYSLKSIRTNHLETEEGSSPIFDYSLYSSVGGSKEGEAATLEEIYSGSSSPYPIFASVIHPPDEYLSAINILEILKDRLPENTYRYIREKIYPSKLYSELIEVESEFRKDLVSEGYSKTKVKDQYDIFVNLTDMPDKELNMICQVAQVLIEELGFSKKELIKYPVLKSVEFTF